MENTKQPLFLCLLVYCLVLHSYKVHSQSLENFFHKGGKLYAANIEHVTSLKTDKDIAVYAIRLGYGSFLFNNFAIQGHLELLKTKGYFKTKPNLSFETFDANSFGIGTSFLFRWYAVKLGSVSFFVDASGGILYTFNSFPSEGTKLNFTARPGAGIAVQINNSQLLFSANRFHLSNGQGYNHPHNPAYDGIGIFIGLIHRSK
tara:strand:+ start:6398 stop:7006 length:609 start_codon:yes stop_codon:yes gene_type:complete